MGLSEGFKQDLEIADKNYDLNEAGDLDTGELNYSEAIKKIDNQYRNIDSFLSMDGIDDKSKKQLSLLKNNLDNFVNKINLDLKNGSEFLFSSIAGELNSHWDGIFEDDFNKIDLEKELSKINFHEVEEGETLSEVVKENYEVSSWSEIQYIISKFYISNPDLIKSGDTIILPKILDYKKAVESGKTVKIDDLFLELFGLYEDKGQILNSVSINPNHLKHDHLYADVIFIDDNGKINVNYERIADYELIDGRKKVLEDLYDFIISDKKNLKVFPEDCITKEDRIALLEEIISKEYGVDKIMDFNNVYDFIMSNERSAFTNAENNYIRNETGDKKWYDFSSLIDEFNETYEQKYEYNSLKKMAINDIKQIVNKGIYENFGIYGEVGKADIENYIYKNIDKEKYKAILIEKGFLGSDEVNIKNAFDEIMSENNFLDITVKLLDENLNPEDRKNLVYDFVNLLSDELRTKASLFKDFIDKIPNDRLKKILPEDFEKGLLEKYQKLETRNKAENPNYISFENFRKEEIEKYFENIEKNEITDISRVNNFVEDKILVSKTELLETEKDYCLSKIDEKYNPLLDYMNNYSQDKIKTILNENGLGENIEQFKNLLSDNIENIFLSNLGKLEKGYYSSDINYFFSENRDWSLKHRETFLGNIDKILESIENSLSMFDKKIKVLNKNIEEKDILKTKESIVMGILSKNNIKHSIGAVSSFRQDYLNEDETDVKNDILNSFDLKSKSEKDLFNTYINMNDSFNETFVLSDNNVESIVNGAVFLAISFGSAGLGNVLIGTSRAISLSRSLSSSLVEMGSFSGLNLSYKDLVKGELTERDYAFALFMSMGIMSATSIVGRSNFKLDGLKVEGNVKKWLTGKAVEGTSVSVAYGGDLKRIISHFAKMRLGNAKAGYVNSTTSGSITYPRNI